MTLGVKYHSQYMPSRTMELPNGFRVSPIGKEEVSLGVSTMHLNCSYFFSLDDNINTLKDAFRSWMIFDAFLLGDKIPIMLFDRNLNGIETEVPKEFHNTQFEEDDFKTYNVKNVSNVVHWPSTTHPEVNYISEYSKFLDLDQERKDLIEWFHARPFRKDRIDPIGRIAFWQILHSIILIDNLFGDPPNCEHRYENCPNCEFAPQPHHSPSRRIWLNEQLGSRIGDEILSSSLARAIEVGRTTRNKMSHYPAVDRSEEVSPPAGETESFDLNRSIEEFDNRAIAVDMIASTLEDLTRYLLLFDLLDIYAFRHPAPLNITTIGLGADATE